MCRTPSRQGFSLVEVLIVMAIIGIIIAMTVPAVQRVRDAACRLECSEHLRHIGLGLHHYHNVNSVFPPGVSYDHGASPYPFMGWQTRILPYIEQEALWAQTQRAFAIDPRFLDNPPHTGLATLVELYTCPADGRTVAQGPGPKAAFTAFLGVEGTDQFSEDGILFLDSTVRLKDIRDGASNTLVVGERPPSADGVLGWWYAGEGQAQDGSADMVLGVNELNTTTYGPGCPRGPYQFGPGRISDQCDAFHFWSLHFGEGAHFLIADGSVRFLQYSAAPLMPALATRAGGEVVSIPD